MSWLGSVMHIMHISFPKIRVTDTVLRMFGDHMMAHKRPSLSSFQHNSTVISMSDKHNGHITVSLLVTFIKGTQ